MTLDEIRAQVALIYHPNFRYCLTQRSGDTFLHVEPLDGVCSVTGDPLPWKSRKWHLSQHAIPSEIVQTAFLATRVALEHELRELFLYRGVAVLGPHFDLDVRAQIESTRDAA